MQVHLSKSKTNKNKQHTIKTCEISSNSELHWSWLNFELHSFVQPVISLSEGHCQEKSWKLKEKPWKLKSRKTIEKS